MFHRFLVTIGSLFALGLGACAPDSGLEDLEQAADSENELSLSFVELDSVKSPAPPGLTILRKKSEYVAHFGTQPPADLNFNKSWVLHYSMGVQETGGYDVAFTSIAREGTGANARLVVHTMEEGPGPNCMVTMALSNPQVTVKIPKQNKTIGLDQTNETSVRDCGTVQNFCATKECGPNQVCDEFQDACVEAPFCPKVKCANGYVCDEDVDACVGRPCEPSDPNSCPANFVCDNQIACITQPCPSEFRCEPAPAPVTCAEIGWVGVCEGTVLKYCSSNSSNDMTTLDCAPGSCEFSQANQYFDCVQ